MLDIQSPAFKMTTKQLHGYIYIHFFNTFYENKLYFSFRRITFKNHQGITYHILLTSMGIGLSNQKHLRQSITDLWTTSFAMLAVSHHGYQEQYIAFSTINGEPVRIFFNSLHHCTEHPDNLYAKTLLHFRFSSAIFNCTNETLSNFQRVLFNSHEFEILEIANQAGWRLIMLQKHTTKEHYKTYIA